MIIFSGSNPERAEAKKCAGLRRKEEFLFYLTCDFRSRLRLCRRPVGNSPNRRAKREWDPLSAFAMAPVRVIQELRRRDAECATDLFDGAQGRILRRVFETGQ
jgi:hypothetical protein